MGLPTVPHRQHDVSGVLVMRGAFPPLVERGRVTSGPMASGRGDTFGLFMIRHPRTCRSFKVMVGDSLGWDHVSVSVGHGRNLNARCPTWGEMCWIKDLFFSPREAVMQLHPPAADYVNDHPACLHLWRPHAADIPLPDPIMVGIGRKQQESRA